jgi:HEPN domain-containing protein
MLPECPEAGTAADWLRYARSDLALAQVPAGKGILLETLCYHLHQAAEKSIKAVLVSRAIPFPKTHNLKILLELVPPTCTVPDAVQQSVVLTAYAVMSRYPGEYEPVTDEEYRTALALAKAVVAWAGASSDLR